MGHYPFTLFNGLTGMVPALTLLGGGAAVVCAVAVRLGFYPKQVRWARRSHWDMWCGDAVGLLLLR